MINFLINYPTYPVILIVFFIQLIIIFDFMYIKKLPHNSLKFVKLCYVSTKCILGGFFFILVFILLNISDLNWVDLGRVLDMNYAEKYLFLDEFFLGYIVTLIIIFLNNCKDKLKL